MNYLIRSDIGSQGSERAIRPFCRSDYLTKILVDRMQLRPAMITLLAMVVLNLPIVVLVIIYGLWESTPDRIGLLHHNTWWIYRLTAIPATIFYFFWLPNGIMRVITGPKANGVFSVPNQPSQEDALRQYVLEFDQSYSRKLWAALSLITSIGLVTLSQIPELLSTKTWQTSHPIVFWYTVFLWGLVFFLGTMNVIRILLSITWFNRLFSRFKVDVKVLHPDKAGGLSPLGEFSVKIGYGIAIYGLAAVVGILSESYLKTTQFTGPELSLRFLPLLVAYLILAPIVFFLPIGAARSTMKRAKNEFVVQIAEQFEIDTIEIQSLLASGADELKRKLDKIEQLTKLYDIAIKFPVWPFNTENLVKFLSAISSPFVVALISVLITVLKR